MSFELTESEKKRRAGLVARMRKTITETLKVEAGDDTSLMLSYSGFHLQIAFSVVHPLMMIHFVINFYAAPTRKHHKLVEEFNLKTVLGCHMIDDEAACYAFRTTHWLDAEPDAQRFLEILERCADEAIRCYAKLMNDDR